jgi:hypothetical protein
LTDIHQIAAGSIISDLLALGAKPVSKASGLRRTA